MCLKGGTQGRSERARAPGGYVFAPIQKFPTTFQPQTGPTSPLSRPQITTCRRPPPPITERTTPSGLETDEPAMPSHTHRNVRKGCAASFPPPWSPRRPHDERALPGRARGRGARSGWPPSPNPGRRWPLPPKPFSAGAALLCVGPLILSCLDDVHRSLGWVAVAVAG